MAEGIQSNLSNAAQLVKLIEAGDKSAEELLIKQFYRGVVFTLIRQTEDAALAEDIAQDAFLIILENIRKGAIQNPSSISGYIRQTAINQLIAYKRKENRRNTHTSDAMEVYSFDGVMCISDFVHNKKIVDMCQQMITEMSSERDRQILRQFFVLDKSKDSVCENLNLSTEHFDRVLYRARNRLKQLILVRFNKPAVSDVLFTLAWLCLFLFYSEYCHVVREPVSQSHYLITTSNLDKFLETLNKGASNA